LKLPTRRSSTCFIAELSIGLALSSAHPLGLAASIAMPALAMRQLQRRAAYSSAIGYYAGALWPLVPCARNFFGPDVSLTTALALWVVACALLAAPWPIVWSISSRQAWWRTPLGLLLGLVPPLGIIGWASPLTAAGLLFPGTAWLGLASCALAPGLLAAWPRYAFPCLAAATVLCNATVPLAPLPPTGWVAIDTHFGVIAHGRTSPTAEYAAAQSIQRAALATDAKVIVFPETVVPTWTAATDTFWRPTLERLQTSGKTIIVGALLPRSQGRAQPTSPDDLAAAVALLRGGPRPNAPLRDPTSPFAYDNAVVIRGADNAVVRQRIPVPGAMWKPFQQDGAHLRLFSSGVIAIRNQRAAVLICYEQLLAWPVISSLRKRPSVVVAVANDHWAAGTAIPIYQRLATRVWSRLFGLPFLSATNL
jgi:predicted amidohydrolase